MVPRLMLLLAVLSTRSLSAQTVVDTSGAGALVVQAMDHSEVMADLQHLSDVIGPRLTGSSAMRRANDWTAERFREYGLSASLEWYQFGVTLGAWPGLTSAPPAVHPLGNGAELGLDRRNRQ
jgi:carboxypeptidase Q